MGRGLAGNDMTPLGRSSGGREFRSYAYDHGGRDDHGHDHRVRVAAPFIFDGYGYDYGSDCWQSRRVMTPAGWRYRSAWACY
jgi:hypothetical protein